MVPAPARPFVRPVRRIRKSGAVLAGAIAVVAVVLFLSVWSAGGTGTQTWVYRIDATDVHGNWSVRAWGLASGPHRAAVLQTQERRCEREAPTHQCRVTTEAAFAHRDGAAAYLRTQCRNYQQDHGHRPPAMPGC